MTPADKLLDALARDHLNMAQDGGMAVRRAYHEWRASLPSAAPAELQLVPDAAPARAEGGWQDRSQLVEALRAAAQQFDHYGRLHEAKGTPESERKAQVNRNFAAMCREACGDLTPFPSASPAPPVTPDALTPPEGLA